MTNIDKGKPCKKCGTSTFNSYVINKLQVALCSVCTNKWLDIRDTMVGKAFDEFIPRSDSKRQLTAPVAPKPKHPRNPSKL